MNESLAPRLVRVIKLTVLIILLVLPFHEFLTTWLASNFGHINLFRVWKEIVLVLITPIVIYLAYINKGLKKWLVKDRLITLIYLFTVIAIILGIVGYQQKHVNLAALGAGMIIDLRFFLIFIITLVISQYTDFFKKYWKQILIYPALLVILFGITQLFLPIDFLRHFGYGPNTIPAFQTVDQQLTFHRIQSTLRGANPLGAYLVLITPIFVFFSVRGLATRVVSSLLSLVALFFTYSRSAYIGLIVTIGIIFYYLKFEDHSFVTKYKKAVYYLLTGIILVVLAAFLILKNNSTFDNVFFHSSGNSKSSTSSNSVRLSSLTTNTKNMLEHPLGQGVGIAGPASTHNNHPAKIAENFYIQIGQETGVLGLAVFIAINIIVGYRLFKKRDDPLSLLLFASLIGITIINMISHAWADDTLSLLWWAFAGVVLSPKLLNNRAIK
ncbi:MAG TPA: O-antigen ligase family protein [Candidatus Saccharimonadales bacterium]